VGLEVLSLTAVADTGTSAEHYHSTTASIPVILLTNGPVDVLRASFIEVVHLPFDDDNGRAGDAVEVTITDMV
jgi:hypothetical protein